MKDKFFVFEDITGGYEDMIVEATSDDEAIEILEENCFDTDNFILFAVYDSEEELDANGYAEYDIF